MLQVLKGVTASYFLLRDLYWKRLDNKYKLIYLPIYFQEFNLIFIYSVI